MRISDWSSDVCSSDLVELDHLAAQALARRDEDLVGFLAPLVVDRLQLLDPRQARLALGAAALGVAARPLEFLLDRLLARLLLRVLALRSEEHTSDSSH